MTCLDNIDFTEIRNWILLIFGTIGAYITIKNYVHSIKQRRIDNTFKTIEFLRRHIGDQQINTFIKLFHANNELTGVKSDEFKFDDGRYDTIETMFSEGDCGNGDIQNLIELFNLISPTLKNLDLEIIWFEYGQIMSKLYYWTKYLEENNSLSRNESFYYEFNKFMKRNSENLLFSPTKYYTYAE